jgi:hypothetical protein
LDTLEVTSSEVVVEASLVPMVLDQIRNGLDRGTIIKLMNTVRWNGAVGEWGKCEGTRLQVVGMVEGLFALHGLIETIGHPG